MKYKSQKAASKPVGQEITNGKDFFEEILEDWETWGPQLDALSAEKKDAIKAIPEFEQRNVLKKTILNSWWIDERDDASVVNSAMEKVKAVLAQ